MLHAHVCLVGHCSTRVEVITSNKVLGVDNVNNFTGEQKRRSKAAIQTDIGVSRGTSSSLTI